MAGSRPSSRRFTVAALLVSAAILLVSGIPDIGIGAEVLQMSAIPDEAPAEIMRIYAPFAEYLSRELGVQVKFVPVVDYAATVEAFAAKKLDLVWYGGFTSVQAARRSPGGATRLVMRQEDATFRSVFVANPARGIRTLEDLRGKTFTFGSVSSTSGHLMPRFFLLRHGIDPDRAFARTPAFAGAHDAAALWVAAGKVDAAALSSLVWDKLVETGRVDTAKVAVFWTTPPYVDYAWTVRADVSPAMREQIAAAFLRLRYDNPEHRRLLDLHRTKGYLRARDEDWRAVEEAALASGLLK